MNEFYVGYQPKAPAGIRRRVVAVVLLLMIVAAVAGVVFSRSQRTLASATFEYGSPRTFEGLVQRDPYPMLLVKRPGHVSAGDDFSRYLLVATGKHGANQQLAGYGGASVRLSGQLIYRDNLTMLEVVSGSLTRIPGADTIVPESILIGTRSVVGEIVDTKCYLGVMNPGQGKVHRDCAARCISGGLPPALATRDFDGKPAMLLLADSANKPLPLSEFIDRVGQPVRVEGAVSKSGDMLLLQTRRAKINPLP
jgi:hypothetical protein